MLVYIIRHAEKVPGDYWNEGFGINDNPLSDVGKGQALALSEYLKGKTIESVHISQYRRTLQTIEDFCLASSIVPGVSGLLNEIDMGVFLRLRDTEAKKAIIGEWDRLQGLRRDYRYAGGESGKDVARRVGAFFRILEGSGKNAAVVTHEAWIKLAACHILGLPPGRRFCLGGVDPGGIMEIEYDERYRKWRILRYGFTL